ncbi:acyltransferase [Mucilaginibacter sp. Bleaf8]|uniref:acyltransferase family protein n=1 Tax=Mucilaginibacter sp. Bleaf8 TaxID=2834430 RepID=UPI001BCEA968|nr:acyltransferase [Mucilaginibacter sp. Bleaf8]MBS7566460.1 acyltransferase [Mucilaginibacter sp. Bleaf8]
MLKPGLVRFLLASIVICYHLSGAIYIGSMAVYCFFALSGYWVTYMYEKKYSKYQKPIVTFYLSRIYRLFPVYLFIGILTFISTLLYHPLFKDKILAVPNIHFWFSNVFLLGYNLLPYKPVVPAWSLDLELQFYLLLPILFAFTKKKKQLVAVIIISALIAITSSALYPGGIISKTVIAYLLYFIIGIAIYRYEFKFSRKAEFWSIVMFISIFLAHCLLGFTDFYKAIKSGKYYELYFNQVLSLFTIPLLCNSLYNKSDNLDRTLGEMSYVLYLTHWMLIIPYNHYITGITKLQRLPFSLAYLLITYTLSYIIFKYYDKPVDKLRRKWLEKQPLAELSNNHHRRNI